MACFPREGHTVGERRIQEVTMVALIFLLLGVVFLLVAVGRIWVVAKPISSQAINSSDSSNPREPVAMSGVKDAAG